MVAGEVARESSEGKKSDSTRSNIRGSSLLFGGKLISMVLNFGIQVLTVRYLSKSDYGAFAYALSVVSIGSSLALLGLDKAIARYVPIYHEKKDYGRTLGALIMAALSILGMGFALVALVLGLRGLISHQIVNDPLAVGLLLIVIAISPMEALNVLFQGTLAVFAKPQAIFFRRYILAPGLKLGAVLLVVLFHQNVYFLAGGYLVGGLLGLIVHLGIVLQVLREQGLIERLKKIEIRFPVAEIYGFALPLLSTDVVLILRTTLVVVLLGYFGSTTDVAAFRAVVPLAGLNSVVMQSFKFLFTPMASRLFAREDREGINELYWKTAIWIALFTFPVFVLTFSLARPLTVLVFEERYAGSAVILALLSVGYFFNSALGFNSYTLRVYGRVKFIVTIDVLTAVLGLALNLLLIPRYGAVGAAIGTTIGLIAYNLLNHLGLLMGTGIDLFQSRYLKAYMSILIATLSLLGLQIAFNLPFIVSLVIAGVISLGLIRINRNALDIAKMFPEILRIPLIKPLLGIR